MENLRWTLWSQKTICRGRQELSDEGEVWLHVQPWAGVMHSLVEGPQPSSADYWVCTLSSTINPEESLVKEDYFKKFTLFTTAKMSNKLIERKHK